jgi:serine/threonine protein phosphatase PrpC
MHNNLFKLVLLFSFTLSSYKVVAHELGQPKTDNNITAPIYALFDGMREHNQEKILAQFTHQALLQRVNDKGQVTNTDVKQFALSISQNNAKLDEHVLAAKINQLDDLASVWTPFAFYLNDKLRHCGSNSFQLVQVDGQWKIHYLIDVTYAGDCQAFVEKHTGQTN